MKKHILRFTLLIIVLFICWNISDIWYGLGQAKGQLHVLYNARPVEDVLKDDAFPDSLKYKLQYIQEVRRFAIDSLGVNNTENYTTLFDQEGKPILWAVNASPAYSIAAYEWCFPIAGCFPYKGYFDLEKAKKEEDRLKKEGYDTYVRSVSGWSTLGFFKDPILSEMLRETEGELAELIIHELTHATLYIKDSADYNENLATFVGNYGALEFLIYKFGKESEQYRLFKASLDDSERFQDFLMNGIETLQEEYASWPESLDDSERDARKKKAIQSLFDSLDRSQFGNPKRYEWTSLEKFFPNNAYFSQFLTYHKEANAFEEEFYEDFHGDFKTYLEYLKKEYGKD